MVPKTRRQLSEVGAGPGGLSPTFRSKYIPVNMACLGTYL